MENIIYIKKFISDEYRIMRSINMEIFLINDAIIMHLFLVMIMIKSPN